MKTFLFAFLFSSLFACTDFVVQAEDGALVNGRSLEFAPDLQNELKLFPRGEKRFSHSPDEKRSLSWTSKYGFLGITCFGRDLLVDGMNEQGLSFGFLWLPGTEYPQPKAEQMKHSLDFVDFGVWALGNFKTIAELKEALQYVVVWGHPVAPLPQTPVHIALHDATGQHLVIEFIKGKTILHDNPNTVLTNAPSFDWHIINLTNYLNLKALNAGTLQLGNSVLSPPGQGSGMLGIPGDWTPPSRFVRITTFLHFAKQPQGSSDAVNLVAHLLNTVDIPLGDVEAIDGSEDYSQWAVIKNLTTKDFYFRTYKDLSLKKVSLSQLNFEKTEKSISLETGKKYEDATKLFSGN